MWPGSLRHGSLRHGSLLSARRPVPALGIGHRTRRRLPVVLPGTRHASALAGLLGARRPRAVRILTVLPPVGGRRRPGRRGANPIHPGTGCRARHVRRRGRPRAGRSRPRAGRSRPTVRAWPGAVLAARVPRRMRLLCGRVPLRLAARSLLSDGTPGVGGTPAPAIVVLVRYPARAAGPGRHHALHGPEWSQPLLGVGVVMPAGSVIAP